MLSAFALTGLFLACNSPAEQDANEAVIAIDFSNMDSTVSPADDFFRFVNGRWMERTEIPSDRSSWGSFHELIEDNNEVVLSILENAATSGEYEEGTDQFKASSFYGIGMDSLLAESSGIQPIKPLLDKVDAIEDITNLQEFLSYKEIFGGTSFFNFYVGTDLKSSNEVTTYFSQSGLGLPDRDYYTKEDEKSQDIREKYVMHVSKMLQLFGEDQDIADSKAQSIMTLETRLANASMTNVERRDTPAQYNKYSIEDLNQLTPSINWSKYFSDMEINGIDTIIVRQPKFMEECERIFNDTPMSTIKDYLIWGQINTNANYLNNEVVKADFDFYRKELRGVPEMRPRWKRVLGATNGRLGEAIGKLYVEQVFPPEAKQKAQEMVENIKLAFADRIKKLEWMSDSTKEKALEKLKKMTVKIGYPDEWRDYSGLVVEGDPEKASYAQNILNARKFGFEYQAEKLGKPVNKKEWGMSPQTVNAYFNPTNNEIVFPAAILQPPFYNYMADDAVNYGGIGAVIGHEISHCFDDQGSKYDADGNLNNWWSEEDLAKFKERTQQLVDQYNVFEPVDSVYVNGAFTLGENIGDLGGVNAAYDGLQMHLAKNGNPGLIDGYTPEQRFFISWGTIWRVKAKDEALRVQVNTDPHSPGMYRANGPIANVPAFYEAFNVKPGDNMYRDDSVRVKIW